MRNRVPNVIGGIIYEPLVRVNPIGRLALITFAYVQKQLREDAPETTAIVHSAAGANSLFYARNELLLLPELILGETLQDRRVKIFRNATSDDLEQVLVESEYQNIILLAGHSTDGSFSLSDRTMYTSDLESIHFARKQGEVLKLTCDSEGADTFATRIADDPSKVFYFGRPAYGFDLLNYSRNRFLEKLVDRYCRGQPSESL